MLNGRLVLYLSAGGLIVLFFVSYLGYRSYQRHIEFERFISDSQELSPIDTPSMHSSNDHVHGREDSPGGSEVFDHKYTRPPHPANGKYVYEIAGVRVYADSPMSQEDLEMEEWLMTGKMTPAAAGYLKNRPKQSRFDGQVIQRVVDPDGKIHTVIVPSQHQYEEGDAVLRSELDVPERLKPLSSRVTATISINGTEYDLPEAYYAIEDRYERAQYQMKFIQAKRLGISMAEADRMVETGEMDLSLSEDQKRRIDKEAEIDERHDMLGTQIILPPLSDKPPVKVRLLPDEDETQMRIPGWIRKLRNTPWSGSGRADPVSEGDISLDTDTPLVRPDAPLSSSDPFSVVELEASNKTPTPPTSESIEMQLKGRLSPERFSKAQQLIDHYGLAEGLRHLREMDPEVARQFERKRRPKPTRNVPDTP